MRCDFEVRLPRYVLQSRWWLGFVWMVYMNKFGRLFGVSENKFTN